MKAYPIWNQVTACIYKSDKSYGAKNQSITKILVGSSKNNSHELGKICTNKTILGNRIIFTLKVNGKIINTLKFVNNNGTAGDLIE